MKVWLSNFDTDAVIFIEGEQAKVDMNEITFKTPVSTLFCSDSKQTETRIEPKVKAYVAPQPKFELKAMGLTFEEAKHSDVDEF